MPGHVAIVLPGRSYGPELPALTVPIVALTQLGVEVVALDYPGGGEGTWLLAKAGRWDSIVEALAPQIARAVDGASKVTVVGKSLGTAVMTHLPALLNFSCDAIWITPLFGDEEVRKAACVTGWRSLCVFGTADPAHDAAAQAEVTAALGATELAIAGANHSLEVPGDGRATLAGHDSLERAVTAFVGRD